MSMIDESMKFSHCKINRLNSLISIRARDNFEYKTFFCFKFGEYIITLRHVANTCFIDFDRSII